MKQPISLGPRIMSKAIYRKHFLYRESYIIFQHFLFDHWVFLFFFCNILTFSAPKLPKNPERSLL